MRLKCFFRAGSLRSLVSPTTRFTRMSRTKTISSRCARFLADVLLAPLPTSLTTRACGGWLRLRKRWLRCSILTATFCPCRIQSKLPAARTRASALQIPSRYFAQTAALTPQLRADGVKKIVDIAQKHKLTTAGIFSSSESVDGIFNSRGLSNWHTQTLADISITMLARIPPDGRRPIRPTSPISIRCRLAESRRRRRSTRRIQLRFRQGSTR